IPVSGETLHLWELAERIGFLVLGRLAQVDDATLARVVELSRRASSLGWLLDAGAVHRAEELAGLGLVGMVAGEITDIPAGIRFLIDTPPTATAEIRLRSVDS